MHNFAGSDATFLWLRWFLYYLSQYPEAQERMAREIQETEEEIDLNDFSKISNRLVYCRAVIHEILRMSSLAGFGGPHYSDRDVKVKDWTIPAGTDIYPGMYLTMNDPDIWDNPRKFDPERFIVRNHGGDPSLNVPPAWMPFEPGPRICPGMKVAMDFMLLSVIKIVTEVKIEAIDDEDANKRKTEPLPQFIGMVLFLPPKHNFKITPLKKSQ